MELNKLRLESLILSRELWLSNYLGYHEVYIDIFFCFIKVLKYRGLSCHYKNSSVCLFIFILFFLIL